MEWTDVDTKKKGQIVQCRLEGPLSNGSSSDGSIYLSTPIDPNEPKPGVCVTTTYLPPKLAHIGKTIVLKHPDSGKEQEWKVVSKGAPRWVNDKGEILWGAK